MINNTTILRYLEKKLGYRFNELEISPNDIIENIKTETLENFSKYFPYKVQHTINVVEDRVSFERENRFYLKTELPILAVKHVYLSNTFYGDISDISGLNRYCPVHRNLVDTQIAMDMLSATSTPITFEFVHPNMIDIFPAQYTKGRLLVDLHCVHPTDFSTIPLNLKDEFLKLCLYDTQEALYQIRHRFANLQTAFGNIELFIDDLQNATEKRDELMEKWRRNAYKSSKRKKLYVY